LGADGDGPGVIAPPLDFWLQEGIAAARSGQVERARFYLQRVVEADEGVVQAWYWLSRVVEAPHERRICLENVLALDPGHTAVQAELAALRRQMAQAGQKAIAAAVPRSAEEELISDAAVEPLLCPYCGQITDAHDRRCPACGRDLYARRPRSKGHSIYSIGLVLAWFTLANDLWLGLTVYYLKWRLSLAWEASPGAMTLFQTLRTLLGLEGKSQARFDLPIASVLLVGGAAFVLSLIVAGGLYRRIPFFYWLTLGVILLYPFVVIYRLVQGESLSAWGLILSGCFFMAALSFAFMAHEEFMWVEERLAAAVDRDVDSPSALYGRGRQYARRGMWATAAAHWSRAVALRPGHPDYRLALASACINLGQPERAREHLQAALAIEPGLAMARELLKSIGEETR